VRGIFLDVARVGLDAEWQDESVASEHLQKSLVPHRFKLEGFGGAEAADYGGGVALVGVDLGIEATHLFFRDFVAQVS
jgi:hypothetical protein